MRVQFTVEFTGRTAPKDRRITELSEWCGIFHRYDLTPPHEGSSLGNLSFRLKNAENSFIITASQLGLKECPAEDAFVAVNDCNMETGTVYAEGLRNPSSESMLHYCIYRERSDVNAIFHGHSALILEAAERLSLPVTRREEPFGTMELVHRVSEILDDRTFLVMKNHGFLALGQDMAAAGKRTLQVYERAGGYLMPTHSPHRET